MKKCLFLLLIIISVQGCKDNPSNPTPARLTKIVNYTCNYFDYNFDAGQWDNIPYMVENGKMDIMEDIYTYCYFSACYGKNWKKGSFDEKFGAPLEITFSSPYSSVTGNVRYSYNNLGYLTTYEEVFDNKLIRKLIYKVENRKVQTEDEYDSTNTHIFTTTYEYDNSGYISKLTKINIIFYEKYTCVFQHDAIGYLKQQIYSDQNSHPYLVGYEYNSSGLLEKEKDNLSTVITYKYNNYGKMTEIKTEDEQMLTTETCFYGANGYPEEIIKQEMRKSDSAQRRTKRVYSF